MARLNGHTADEVIAVIPGTGGIISLIATRLGVSWNTAQRYILKFPTIRQAYEDEKKAVDDKAVSNIYKAIGEGDLETSKWWVRMKMPDEYAPRQDVTSGGEKLEFIVRYAERDNTSEAA